jgi:hypothetical protein
VIVLLSTYLKSLSLEGQMSNDTWEQSRMLIMTKLKEHTEQLAAINKDINTFQTSFQIGMTELKTKVMIATGVINLVVGAVVAFVMSKVLG